MGKLSKIGRIFYGIAISGLGLGAICYNKFPYMLGPPIQLEIPLLSIVNYVVGALLIFAGGSIILQKGAGLSALLLGSALLLTVCCCFIPYELMGRSSLPSFGEWENAEKELALSGGALLIARGGFLQHTNLVTRFLRKLVPLGGMLFLIPIFIFGIDHYLYTKDAATLVPSWISHHIFWTYLAGTALIVSSISLMFKIKAGLMAILLGSMIFIWFMILHVPRVIISSFADRGDEITSAFLALAYSGIAFVIAGASKNPSQRK